MRLAKAGLLAALITACAATSALAAYAPKLQIKLDPATPGAPAAITSTITQASGETANKTVVVKFPAGFGINSKTKVNPCTPAQEQSDSCPDASQVGNATAVTSLGSLTGPVYFELDQSTFKLVVYLKGFGGLISQKIVGTVALQAGSPALGSGGTCTDPSSAPPGQPLVVDQRGLPRPSVGCDIGAIQILPADESAPAAK